MSIKIETTPVLSEGLKSTLIKVASKYYPDGGIKYYGTPEALRRSIQNKNPVYFTYYPTSEEHPPLALIVKGNQVVDVDYGTDFDIKPKLRAFIDAFDEAKKRVAEKQLAEKQAPVKKGIEVRNSFDRLRPQDLDNIRKVASMYYPSGSLDIREIDRGGHLVNVFDTGNPQYGTIKFYSHYSTLGALDVGLPNETDPKMIEHKKAFINAYDKFKLDAYNEAKQKIEPDTVLSVAPVKPQLPTIDISKFSGVGLPNSAYQFSSGNIRFELKGKPHQIVVKVAQTQETSTAYLKIVLNECWTGGRPYQHRFMGKTPTELIRKLETFLSVPAESLNILLDETYYEDLKKSSYAVNAKKTANFLAQCPIKK